MEPESANNTFYEKRKEYHIFWRTGRIKFPKIINQNCVSSSICLLTNLRPLRTSTGTVIVCYCRDSRKAEQSHILVQYRDGEQNFVSNHNHIGKRLSDFSPIAIP